MSALLRSALLRRGLREMRRTDGLRLNDFCDERDRRVLAVLERGFSVNLEALDAFLAKPNYWDSTASLQARRDELSQRRADADAAFANGQIDLAITTIELVNAEAKLVGMRVTANPVMVTHRKAQERGKSVNKKSADKRAAETERKFERFDAAKALLIKKYGKVTKDALAKELRMSVPTLNDCMRKKKVEI